MLTRSLILALSFGMTFATPRSSSHDPEQLLPVYGGSGGTSFSRDCGAGKVLTGLRSRGGLLVDAIGLLCRPVAADGTLGSQSTVGTLAGGGGGTSGTISCAIGAVAYHANISHGSYVNGVSLTCKPWNAAKREVLGQAASAGSTKGSLTGTINLETCESPKQPMVGIRGRASWLVDAIGFICDEP